MQEQYEHLSQWTLSNKQHSPELANTVSSKPVEVAPTTCDEYHTQFQRLLQFSTLMKPSIIQVHTDDFHAMLVAAIPKLMTQIADTTIFSPTHVNAYLSLAELSHTHNSTATTSDIGSACKCLLSESQDTARVQTLVVACMTPSADPLATAVVETVMLALSKAKGLEGMLARDIHGQKCVVDFAHRVSSYLVTTEPSDSRFTELHLLLKALQPWVGNELKYVFDTFGSNADAFHAFVDALVELSDMNIWFRKHVTSDGNTLDDTRIRAVNVAQSHSSCQQHNRPESVHRNRHGAN